MNNLLPQSSLLAVFAHPDDESFRCGGMLALLAGRGVKVHVWTATHGEAGSCGDPPLCQPAALGAVRVAELRCACTALGIAPPIVLGYRDGALAAVAEAEAVAQLLAVIAQLRPQALLTWPPDGLSGHPDHIAVSRWTTLAFAQAAGLGPQALYHLAMPRSIAERLGFAQLHTVPDADITLTVDVTPVWQAKLAAIRCYQTQQGEAPILTASPEQQQLFLGWEHFRRVV